MTDNTPDADILMGSKRITPKNFGASDVSRAFGFTEVGWIAWFDEVQLDTMVPEPVRRLFELARGTMIYGWFYYPLLSFGTEECTRCLEAGARHAAAIAKLCPEPEKQAKIAFYSIIEKLVNANLIDQAEFRRWDTGRELRNAAAHPTTPTILAPSDARATLALIADQLNSLFKRLGNFAPTAPGRDWQLPGSVHTSDEGHGAS